MVTKTFFRKVEEIHRKLEVELAALAEEEKNIIILAERSLMKIDYSIRVLKDMLKEFNFESIAEEVCFFKHHKPLFISKFVYFSRLLDIESTKPGLGGKSLRKYYDNELLKIKKYYSQEHELYNYYRRNATYLDHKYFIRRAYDLKMKLSSNLYDFDDEFTTVNDHKIAVFMAYSSLEKYLMLCLKEYSGNGGHSEEKSKLQWTSSKVSLLELLYALHLTHCFNGGNVDFIEIVRHTEKTLSLNLGNVYKTVGEIKNRKYKRKRFLELLSDNLEKSFEVDDR